MGKLFIVATPIGNLEDITLRGLRALREADFIIAEDTRHTLKLLNHYGVKKPMLSCHEHNEREHCDKITGMIASGLSGALVSDAGTPLISDPGGLLVGACRGLGIEVVACPGACACVAALAVSGISSARFCFEGFLPAKKKDRLEALAALKRETRTIVLYEAPHRLNALLSDIRAVLGNRRVSVVRELTKLHEQIMTDSIDAIMEHYSLNEPRGEFTVVIEGEAEKNLAAEKLAPYTGMDIREHVETHIRAGLSETEAMKRAARERGVSKSEIYKIYKTGKQ